MLINVNFNELLLELDSLSVYRNLLNDSVIKKLYELGDLIYKKEPGTDEFIKKYNEFFFELTSGSIQSLKEHIIELILFDENPYSRQSEKLPFENIDKDLDRLHVISALTSRKFKFREHLQIRERKKV